MEETHHFRLFILGKTRKSAKAISNLENLCEKHFGKKCRIDVVDLEGEIQLAEEQQIWATPMLERLSPEPTVRIAGDLSDEDSVLELLGNV